MLESKEKEELEKNGQLQELLEKERGESLKVKSQLNDYKKSLLKKDLNFNVAKMIDRPLADGASVDDVIDQILKTGIVEVNDDETEFLNVNQAYEEVLQSKGYLFSKPKVPVANAIPGNNAPKEKQPTKDELYKKAIASLTKK